MPSAPIPDRRVNKVAIVTGSGQGIGRGVADRLAAEGAHIVIAEYNQANAELAAHEIQAQGWVATAYPCDISDLDQIDAIFEGRQPGVIHSAYGTPNDAVFGGLLAELEGAEAIALTAGGMSALAATLLTMLHPGAHVVASHELFGETTALLRDLERWLASSST